MSRPKVWLSWSSGKDSAWALQVLREQGDVDVTGLVTTLNETHDRVAMHAVRRTLLEAQAQAAGLPLWPVFIPSPCNNEQYEAAMATLLEKARAQGVSQMAFGDLFLADIRAYRESRLAGTGIEPLFPLWQQPTAELARTMIVAGVVAHITCVDPRQLSPQHAGQPFSHAFLETLPDGVDPCGENGEFHTFVSAGPMLSGTVPIEVGPVVERDGFVFCDVRPRGSAAPDALSATPNRPRHGVP